MQNFNTLHKYFGDVDVGSIVVYINPKHSVEDWINSGQLKGLWVVSAYHIDCNRIELTNLLKKQEWFDTDIDNVLDIRYIANTPLFNSKYIKADYICKEVKNYLKCEAKPALQKSNRDIKNMKSEVIEKNTSAAKQAAKITAGKAINRVVREKVKPHLPILLRGYSETPLADVVLANIASFAVDNFAPHNKKAALAASAMMEAAMVDFLAEFNLDQMISDVLAGVEIPVEED